MFTCNNISCSGYERNTITHLPKRGSKFNINISLAAKNDKHHQKQKKKRGKPCPPHSLLEFVIRLKVVTLSFSC